MIISYIQRGRIYWTSLGLVHLNLLDKHTDPHRLARGAMADLKRLTPSCIDYT